MSTNTEKQQKLTKLTTTKTQKKNIPYSIEGLSDVRVTLNYQSNFKS